MEPDNKLRPKEITYRVGWRSGKIRVGKDGKVLYRSRMIQVVSELDRYNQTYIWKEAPFLNERALLILLWAVPITAFAVTVALIAILRSFPN